MNTDIARDVTGPRQKTGIVHTDRLDLAGDVGCVPQEPHFLASAHGQPLAVHGQAHRPVERADQRRIPPG